MRYLFIYPNGANIGGVQTLIARLAEGLLENGHSACVVFFSSISEPVNALLPEQCIRLSVPQDHRQHLFFPLSARRWIEKYCGDADVCVTFEKTSMHFAAANRTAFKHRPALISYIVNDYEHVRTKKKFLNRFYSNMFYDRYFLKHLPDSNKAFMSEAVLRLHQEGTGMRFPGAHISPLPIKSPKQFALATRESPRLVSIGRIDLDMKTYNFTVPSVVRELRSLGHSLTWDIYGGGSPDAIAKLRCQLELQDVADSVKLHGELPYSEMSQALDKSTAFIGMGTAAIEAAMAGIPSIIAVANAPDATCYGLLCDVPFGICGEQGVYWVQRHSVKTTLSNLITCPPHEYNQLAERCRASAMQYEYSKTISSFIKHSKQSRNASIPTFPLLWSVLLCLNKMRSRFFGCVP